MKAISRSVQTGVVMLSLLTLVTGLNSYAQGTYLDNKGTDFIMAFLPNYQEGGSRQLQLTADAGTTVRVEYPTGTFFGNFVASPGVVTIVTLPNTVSSSWVANSVQNNTVRASSTNEFVCYICNIQPQTSDAGLALPVDTMNTEYIVIDYNPAFERGANFCVVAAFDNTTVTIKPTRALIGHAAGVPFSVLLNRGQGYYAQSTDNNPPGNTGTIINSDRPVGLTEGDACTQIPTGTTFCDHIFEVGQPTQTWGTNVPVANLPNRTASLYRIMASQDATTITMDGVVLTNLNRAQWMETILAGDHFFHANKPFYICQFMVGNSYSGSVLGDPAMCNMIPSDQYLNAYTFSTVGGSQFAQNWLTVIAETADAVSGGVILDGAPIPAASFTLIPTSAYSVARLQVAQGPHNTSSRGFHGITVEGYNSADSYQYPGGARFQFINPVGDHNPPICQLLSTTNTSASATVTDNRPTEDVNGNGILDPGEDLNGNGVIDRDTGVFFVQLAAGSVNLQLNVTAFVPGDPIVHYTVNLINPALPGTGTVVASDGAGNTCSLSFQLPGLPSGPVLTVTPAANRGYYQLSATSGQYSPSQLTVYVKDSASAFVAGPYPSGTIVKIKRSLATGTGPASGPASVTINVLGDGQAYAADPGGLTSPVTTCRSL